MFALLLVAPLLLLNVLAQAPGNLRLRGGLHVYEGRLEIFKDGEWGTICDNSWSIQDADVACRQLGFSGALKAVPNAFYGVGDGAIWLDEVRCRGDELSLLACDNGMTNKAECEHEQDAGVVCIMPDMIRLADGGMPNAGRLEIYHDNRWGTVCHDEFGDEDGTVVCQQLGYTRLKGFNNQTNPGTGEIWLDDVNCSSSHVRLSQCKSRGWGTNDCRHSDDVNVICEGVPMEPGRPCVTAVTCGDLVLQWKRPSVVNGNDIHRYYIRYRAVNRSANWTYLIIDDPLEDHVIIHDLSPATSYEVAIAASNVVGNSSYSQSVVMATHEIAFDPPVIVGVADGGSGTLHISWNYSVSDDCGISPDTFIIEYSDGVDTYRLTVSTTNSTITGLAVNVHYNISVRVGIATTYGYVFSHPSASIIAVSMPTTAPVIAPGQLSTWTINASAILLSWQCTDERKSGYIIVCQERDNPTNFWVRNVTDTNLCSHLEHVRTSIVYTCMVASFNTVRHGPFSNLVYTVPEYEEWNPVPSVTILAVTVNSVTMAIEQGSHDVPDGYVFMETIGYNVTCQLSSFHSHVAVWGSPVTVTVDKLSPEQRYYCNIIAINKFGVANNVMVTVDTPSSAPTGMPRGLFINDQINSLYLHWLPPATDKQHGMIIDYNISCVIVEDGSDPYDTTLHDTSNAWSLLISQLGYHPNNDKSINVAMPMFTPFRLISCRVAGINKNGQGPYNYHLATITPPGFIHIPEVLHLQVNATDDNTIVFLWQPLSDDNITKLAVKGYLLQCHGSHDNHTWEYTVWDPRLSMATVPAYQFPTAQQYSCNITAFNPMGFGLHSNSAQLQLHGSSSSEVWYKQAPVIYILLSLIGVTMVIIILLLSCLCYFVCHHSNKRYSGKNEITGDSINRMAALGPAAMNKYTEYESLDNLYDKTTPSHMIQPANNTLNTSLDNDDEQLPAEEEYMKMAPSRSCSHATIKSEILRSGDVKLHQTDYGCQDNKEIHYNSLPKDYSHYDVPPNNHHSNSVNNYYDTPRSHKLTNTK